MERCAIERSSVVLPPSTAFVFVHHVRLRCIAPDSAAGEWSVPVEYRPASLVETSRIPLLSTDLKAQLLSYVHEERPGAKLTLLYRCVSECV